MSEPRISSCVPVIHGSSLSVYAIDQNDPRENERRRLPAAVCTRTPRDDHDADQRDLVRADEAPIRNPHAVTTLLL